MDSSVCDSRSSSSPKVGENCSTVFDLEVRSSFPDVIAGGGARCNRGWNDDSTRK